MTIVLSNLSLLVSYEPKKRMKLKYIFILSLFLGIFLTAEKSFSQGQIKSIVFTGRIVGGKQAQPLVKAYIFIPSAGRGTLSDESGFFALAVFPGDSIVFSYLGFHKQFHVIPRRLAEESYSAIIMLKEDIKTLAEVKVYPYATEEEFKKAFLEMKLPDEADRAALAQSTNKEYMLQMMAITPMSAATNYRYFMDQQMFARDGTANKNFATSFPFLNPFALASFFNSVKKGDLKQKEYRKILSETPRENLSRKDFLKNNGN